ncbi:Adenylate kinase/UMP-CMP kinase family and P-loop containing nucleoside triphosphate hydrolase domain-containing protein [Strongyloides ratti]|uniref:Adenylate kinase/UMP-CMP kinase family and P-loop containing nucleoside triphosphate hydrolase domain-containing protein n=1 Tax=Strongyloides ratti TaxID=34506 RepID=A0A090KRL8_STRRB|nr:Adenylate kinase/UMP-CMP kinase family and P-loop containing nucleoside triphosphate hydrolase domain-containing protein [Strongyloides ratti]CEF60139.1 Adenylate kinase/UMP-CMP kinase family and P-loop containing nucleoside triphosphate hydrolase domain-containing protein [Strongyloides ratti]
MGCSVSIPCDCKIITSKFRKKNVNTKKSGINNGGVEESENDSINNDKLDECLATPPEVKIEIGNGIRKDATEHQSIIVIFGGPGSLKGLITQELGTEFEFTTINVEDIIFNYLPNKVANTVNSIVEIQQLLKRDKGIITLDWVFSMISTKLATSTSQRFLIDIVPELSIILKTDAYKNADVEATLKNFERRHSIMFVLNIEIENEHILLDGKKTQKKSDGIDNKDLSPELSAFLKGVDEADKGLLEKRIDAFHKNSKPFVEYFRKTKRVIDIDIKIPYNPNVVPKVKQIISDFGLANDTDQSGKIVLFMRDENQFMNIDVDYYKLKKIRLSEVCPDKNGTLSAQIRSVKRYILNSGLVNENYLVILDNMNNTDYALTKRVNFFEQKTTYLDYFIQNRKSGSRPKRRNKLPLRCLSSPNGEICLFPLNFSQKICKKITLIFSEKLSKAEDNEIIGSGESSPSVYDSSSTNLNKPRKDKNLNTNNTINGSQFLRVPIHQGIYSANGRQRRRISNTISMSLDKQDEH